MINLTNFLNDGFQFELNVYLHIYFWCNCYTVTSYNVYSKNRHHHDNRLVSSIKYLVSSFLIDEVEDKNVCLIQMPTVQYCLKL